MGSQAWPAVLCRRLFSSPKRQAGQSETPHIARLAAGLLPGVGTGGEGRPASRVHPDDGSEGLPEADSAAAEGRPSGQGQIPGWHGIAAAGDSRALPETDFWAC